MAHKVICFYCKKQFDRDKEPTKQVSTRRYAHLKCWEEHEKNLTKEEKDIRDFYEYTKILFKEDYNYILTKKLAEKYVKENNFTYSGMLKTLKWYYEKEGHSLDKSNGTIGIIPYIYNQALSYYYNLYKTKLLNEKKDVADIIKPQVRFINIESPRVYVRPPQLWFDEEEDEQQ